MSEAGDTVQQYGHLLEATNLLVHGETQPEGRWCTHCGKIVNRCQCFDQVVAYDVHVFVRDS